MTMEVFDTRERRATKFDAQLSWLAAEMGYSRDKTAGYMEKQERLTRDPEDAQSVFGFMSGYWHRFRQANDGFQVTRQQDTVNLALQLHAKVVAGLCDKVAFSIWKEAQLSQIEVSSDFLVKSALERVKSRADELADQYSPGYLATLPRLGFEENPMGQAVLALHEQFADNPANTSAMQNITIEGAAAGMVMLQQYGRHLENSGFSSELAKPGRSSGDIEPWV